MGTKHIAAITIAVLFGCGCSSTRLSKSTPTPAGVRPPASARTTSPPTSPTVASTTVPPSSPSTTTTPTTTSTTMVTGSEVSAAVRVVESHGFTPNDTEDYAYPDFRGGLHVIIASVTGSADGYSRRAFFFVHGRYVGTDLEDTSAIIRVEWRDDTTIALGYAIYKSDDPMCCPLGGGVTVRYHWNGARLMALDPIPSLGARR